eukprot:4541092-Prymnesium_polylepis.1
MRPCSHPHLPRLTLGRREPGSTSRCPGSVLFRSPSGTEELIEAAPTVAVTAAAKGARQAPGRQAVEGRKEASGKQAVQGGKGARQAVKGARQAEWRLTS